MTVLSAAVLHFLPKKVCEARVGVDFSPPYRSVLENVVIINVKMNIKKMKY